MMKAEFTATKAQDAFFNWESMPVDSKTKRLVGTKFSIKRKKRQSPEADMQAEFFYWLGYNYPHLRMSCFAVPNGGSRNLLEARNLQRCGVTPGIPDVLCLIAKEQYHGLMIEFKANKNKLTPTQKQMFERFKKEGYQCKVCYSLNEAMQIFEEYINETS